LISSEVKVPLINIFWKPLVQRLQLKSSRLAYLVWVHFLRRKQKKQIDSLSNW